MFELRDVMYHDVLNIPSLRIDGGVVTSLIGPSGSGKTTILKLLNKMLSPTHGQILFNGQDLCELDSVTHRRSVTMLSQTATVFEGSIKDNLAAGLRFQKRPIPDDSVLDEMLVLGRVLLLGSPVYLLDEPSSALDEATAQAVVDMITRYVKSENKTMVMVTHSTAIARQFSDRIIRITQGSIQEGQV